MATSSGVFRYSVSEPTEVGAGRLPVWHSQPALLHQLVRAQARRTPDRIAAVYEDQWLTYDELVTRSGNWASHLHRLGVEVGTLVGICLERSLDLPVIVLAVLEAGGVCVPLEPSDPTQRIAAMIREAAPSVIVTQSRCRQHLPPFTARLVVMDDETPGRAEAPMARLVPDDLAFVLLTSGSTGAPKGVMVSHATIAARMFRPESDLPDAGSCMAIMKTPISNSPFIGEMFAPLLHGCHFAIARPEGHQDVPYLGSLIRTHGVTHIAMTSAMLRAFLDWPESAQCQSLEAVQCGGDVVSDELRGRFLARFPKARFSVTYGTTESGHALSCECPASERLEGTRIGRPIQHSFVELLDRALEPIPPGEVGEIYLGGPRLATGYLNRPAWTAERFVPHPSSTVAGDRMYRPGDLGRVRPDGDLEFKGRVDQQVKIRGNRVELLEIEAALIECPGVCEAVVLARTAGPGDAQLIAYIVVSQGRRPNAQEMRDRLSKRLPWFMCPRFFVTLDQIPRTANGKVDRKALLALDPKDNERRLTGYVEPRTPTEWILADIWQELLGVERVGRHENFFALGGHSILAARACHQIQCRLRQKIPLSAFFGATNLALLADTIVKEQTPEPAVVVIPLQTHGGRPPVFLMPTISGAPALSGKLLACLDADRPLFALGMAGDGAPWGERTTLPEIARHCVAAIRDTKFDGPIHLMGYSFSGILAYEVARQLHDAGIQVGRVAIIDAWLEKIPGYSRWIVLRNVRFFFANLPHWVSQFMLKKSLAKKISAIRGRLHHWKRRLKRAMSREKTPPGFDWSVDVRKDLPDQFRRRVDVNFKALQSYVPGRYAGRVLLFRPKTRPLFHGLTPDLNWGLVVTGGVEVITIPGDHDTILQKPNSALLAAHLRVALDNE